jgi:S-(hydroxymethyl)glutathione dehydrogenase / alcohol dehydrogenase
MTIKSRGAIAYRTNEPLVIDTIDVESPGPGEVLVEIKATGLCHTDLSAVEGKNTAMVNFPGIPGHEAGGVVVELGSGVTSLAVGDHVVPFMCCECRKCNLCRSGKTNLCVEMFAGHDRVSRCSCGGNKLYSFFDLGTFANYGVYREISLAKVRKDAPFEQIAYLGCGATTGLGAVLFTAKVESGSTVIVLGMGGIGLSIVQGARIAGASTIIAVDTNPSRELLARKMGATLFVDPKALSKDLVSHLVDISGGGADYTFEAVGSIATMHQALACTRMGWGVCTIVGLAPEGVPLEVMPRDMLLGRKLQGSALGGAKCRTDLPKLVDQLMEGKFDLESLITRKLSLDQINDGYEMMKRGEGIRSVVMF